jgi:O-antigen/teichoic acid export membrane protein
MRAESGLITLGASVRVVPQAMSLRRNFSWTLFGNIGYAASQWMMLVAVTKLGTPEMVGQFALGLAATAPVMLATNLNLRGIQATDARQEFDFGDYLGLRLLSALLALSVIVASAWLLGYPPQTFAIVVAVGVVKAVEGISDICFGWLQRQERMDRVAKSLLMKGPLALVAWTVSLYATGSILWSVVALAIASGAVLLLYDLPHTWNRASAQCGTRLLPRWRGGTLLRLVWLGLPLGLVMMLISLNTNLPRLALERSFGTHELGIFAALAYLIFAGTTVVNALGQSASPRLSRSCLQGDQAEVKGLLRQLLLIAAVLGAVGISVGALWGRTFLALLYTPEYAAYADVLVWVMVAAALYYLSSVFGYGMTSARWFRPQLPLQLLCTAVTITGCFLLVPHHGIRGAAWTLIAAAATQLLGGAYITRLAITRVVPPLHENSK